MENAGRNNTDSAYGNLFDSAYVQMGGLAYHREYLEIGDAQDLIESREVPYSDDQEEATYANVESTPSTPTASLRPYSYNENGAYAEEEDDPTATYANIESGIANPLSRGPPNLIVTPPEEQINRGSNKKKMSKTMLKNESGPEYESAEPPFLKEKENRPNPYSYAAPDFGSLPISNLSLRARIPSDRSVPDQIKALTAPGRSHGPDTPLEDRTGFQNNSSLGDPTQSLEVDYTTAKKGEKSHSRKADGEKKAKKSKSNKKSTKVIDDTEKPIVSGDTTQEPSPTSSVHNLFESDTKAQNTSRRKANLSYEMRNLKDSEPSQDECSFVRSNVTAGKQRLFMVLLLVLLVLTMTMICIQFLGAFKINPCCLGKEDKLKLLEMRLKYIEAKSGARTKDLDLLRQKVENQQALIMNLRNVLRIYNMTSNMTVIDAKIRDRRTTTKSIINKKLGSLPNNFVKVDDLTNKISLQLGEKIASIKLTPGPKGEDGPRGFYSFENCHLHTLFRTAIADSSNLQNFIMHITAPLEPGMTIVQVTCSSEETLYTQFNNHVSNPKIPDKDKFECMCRVAKQAGEVTCLLIRWMCPSID